MIKLQGNRETNGEEKGNHGTMPWKEIRFQHELIDLT